MSEQDWRRETCVDTEYCSGQKGKPPEGRKTANKRRKREWHRGEKEERRRRMQAETEERQRKNQLSIRLVGGQRLPTWGVEIEGHPCAVRLDTGAEESILAGRLAHLGTWIEDTSNRWLEGASGGLLRVKGRVRLEWTIEGRQVIVKPLVVDGLSEDLLLGNPFFDHHGCQVAYDTRTLNFPKWGLEVPFGLQAAATTQVHARRATVVQTHGISAMSGSRMQVAIDAPDGTEVQFVPDRTNRKNRCLLAATVATVANGNILVPVLNGTEDKGHLLAQEEVGSWTPLSDELQVLDQPEDTTREDLIAWLAQIAETPWQEPSNGAPAKQSVAQVRTARTRRKIGSDAMEEGWRAVCEELNLGETVPRRENSSEGQRSHRHSAVTEVGQDRGRSTVTPESVTAVWGQMLRQLEERGEKAATEKRSSSVVPVEPASAEQRPEQPKEVTPQWRRPPVAEDQPQLTATRISVAQVHSDKFKQWREKAETAVRSWRQCRGIWEIETSKGWKMVLPPELWIRALNEAHGSIREHAKAALEKSQRAMAVQFNKKVKYKFYLRKGLYVWIWYPAKGKGLSKLRHRWRGPARLEADAGFDNWKVMCAWNGQPRIIHSSSCVPYFSDDQILSTMVQDIEVDATTDDDPWPETEEVVELRPIVGTELEPVETTR
ncbi:hypothetical protein DYB36_010305, partial [Aphanomyces astaci]